MMVQQMSLFEGVDIAPVSPATRPTSKLRDADLEKWNYSPHTGVKHSILRYYLAVWARILSATHRPLAVVDGFAGRGRYQTGEPGSPLLILDTLLAHPDQTQQFVCHFVEKDSTNFANMVDEVNKHRAVVSSRVRCLFYNTSFTAASQDIISRIRAGDQPSFFFVDPFGYSDPPMSVLAEVLRLPKAEVFVNLMFKFVNRALTNANPALAETLDRLLGCRDWRRLVNLSGAEREHAFINLYRRQMKQQGAQFIIPCITLFTDPNTSRLLS